MNSQYEVLNPWSEVDPIPLKGISPRVANLADKKIGLYRNDKLPAKPMLEIVERKLKERFPSLEFSHFFRLYNIWIEEGAQKSEFEEWVKGLDAVIFSHAD